MVEALQAVDRPLSQDSLGRYVGLISLGAQPQKMVAALDQLPLPMEVRQDVLEAGGDWRISEALRLIDGFDPATFNHVVRVGAISAYLARFAGYNQRETRPLVAGALAHDLGKTGIDVNIVHPPDVATSKVDYTPASADRRFAAIQLHPEVGYLLARNLFRDEPDPAYKNMVPHLVLTHHCHNASRANYPNAASMQKLEDEGVLVRSDLTEPFVADFGGILALADVYEAVTANRTYTTGNGFENPENVLKCLVESHPSMRTRADHIMEMHLRRFPPDGWIPEIPLEERGQ